MPKPVLARRLARDALCGVLLITSATVEARTPSDEADLILTHAEIYTPDGWAEAMAVRRGVILAVGDDAAVRRHRGAGTQVMDLGGAAVLPGLHDMHVHPMGSGLQRRQCRFGQGLSLKAVKSAISACAAERAPGEWIVGGQWDVESLGTPPHRSMLDEVSPENPVVLSDISGHSVWANSRALEAAGITADTANPDGGVIEADADGEPTGILRESATFLVRGQVPAPSPDENAEALAWSLDLMLSHGITSLTDAGVGLAGMQAYAAIADRGVLEQRVRGCIMWRPIIFSAGDVTSVDPLTRANLYARDRFSPDCVKVVLDGVPTDGHTAAMIEPYADSTADGERARGILMVPPEELNATVIDLDARGFTVKFHSAGDAAVRAGLDAIAAARAANGFTDNLHDLGHNSFIALEDTRRARAIGATFEMSPYIWYPNPIIPDIAKAIGPKRMKRWTPVKDAIDGGALVVPGSDWAVVPSVNPWIGIETLVTRRAPGGEGEPLGDPITLEQAIELFTVNAARQMGNAHRTGRIAPGLLADVIALDRNPFEIPITEVHRTRVTMAMINGEVVYESGE